MLMSGLALAAGVNEFRKARATTDWPTTVGTILSSSIGKVKTGRSYVWVPRVSFRYQLGPQSYTSSRYSAQGMSGFFIRRSVERILSRYPIGAHVVVAYSPADPGGAVLAAGVRPILGSLLRFFGAALFALAMALYLAPQKAAAAKIVSQTSSSGEGWRPKGLLHEKYNMPAPAIRHASPPAS
ncbi:MAG: DUF3592 domain-containing protein [Pseudomonadota bacterium]|nr:DUF3592 domain-containing protein [Pseudomonadota bacterium]